MRRVVIDSERGFCCPADANRLLRVPTIRALSLFMQMTSFFASLSLCNFIRAVFQFVPDSTRVTPSPFAIHGLTNCFRMSKSSLSGASRLVSRCDIKYSKNELTEAIHYTHAARPVVTSSAQINAHVPRKSVKAAEKLLAEIRHLHKRRKSHAAPRSLIRNSPKIIIPLPKRLESPSFWATTTSFLIEQVFA